jgi:hypothetical protein
MGIGRIGVFLGMLLPAVQALAQPQNAAIENVIVTAPKQRPERALDNFIIAHAAPAPGLAGKIARWRVGVCPITIGMSDKFNLFINQRIIRVAMMAGAPLDAHEPCRPNVAVLATPRAQELLDFVRARRPSLLGFPYRARAERAAAMRRPIQAWYATATEDFFGLITADLGLGDHGYGVMSTTGEPAGMNASGNRAIGDGVKSEFTTAVIIVDSSRIAGSQIGALADYIAMLALSQAPSYDSCQDIPTITNLMAGDCGGERKPASLTDIDLDYLRGLYHMDAGRSYMLERGSIAYEMKKELGGY